MSQYCITAKPYYKDPTKWALHNHEDLCGMRLYKGEDPKDSKQVWPFRKFPESKDWLVHDDKKTADKFAAKLQVYLDARITTKKKNG